MDTKKSKNILYIPGVLHGHFTGNVEIIKQLVSLGYNVTCYVLDIFAERLKNSGAKLEVLNIDRSDFDKLPPQAPKFAQTAIVVRESYDCIFSIFSKDQTKYDYLLIDIFFDFRQMNKILKFPLSNIIIVYPCFCITDMNINEIKFGSQRERILTPIMKKYNLELHDYIPAIYNLPPNIKLILTSKLFHLRSEELDNTCYLIGPSIEEREYEGNFNFKKDPNKKLIYISLGTIIHENNNFYSLCFESFKNSEKYQVLISAGEHTDLKAFKVIPDNFSIFNYVVQTEVLKIADIFITHGGLNSTQEGLLNHIPLIIIPQVNDAFDNAKRVQELEAGIILDKDKLSVDILKDAVNTIDSNREKFKKGVEKIYESFQEARNQRKDIFEKILC